MYREVGFEDQDSYLMTKHVARLICFSDVKLHNNGHAPDGLSACLS